MEARTELHQDVAGQCHASQLAVPGVSRRSDCAVLGVDARRGCGGVQVAAGQASYFVRAARAGSAAHRAVQTLDDPAPQMVEQLSDILQFFRALSPDPEQVVEVPKILPEDVSVRIVVREPQLVEQLVEVPTLVSPSLPVSTSSCSPCS